VAFAGSVVDPGAPPPAPLPQIAFSGRSNVGKSSLINVLLQRTRKKIAHVSGSPGKTQTLNFYQVNDDFFLVDLPGFGYAKVPKSLRSSWQELIARYLRETPELRGVVYLVDARHPPTDIDRAMVERLADVGLPALIVLTKVDKLGARERAASITRAASDLVLDEDQLLPFSSKTREGRADLLDAIEELLGSSVEVASGSAGAGEEAHGEPGVERDVEPIGGPDVGSGDVSGTEPSAPAIGEDVHGGGS